MKNNSLLKSVELFLDDKPSVFALRQQARNVLENIGFPSKKNELWKYTDVKEIINSDFDIAEACEEKKCSCGCDKDCRKNECFIDVKFCKGRLHIEDFDLPKGVNVLSMPEVLYEGEYKKYIFNSFDMEKHPFGALNGVYLEQGIVIEVEKDVECLKPLVIHYHNDGADKKQMNIHNIILLGANAKVEIVENFVSDNNNAYLMNVVNEIYLKKDSVCKHYKVQNESLSSYHIAQNAIQVYEGAKYKQIYYSKGAKISRNETNIDLMEKGANAEVYTMYRAKNGCLTDITTNVNHKVMGVNSNQYAKAVLEDGSRACFQGKVKIWKDAVECVGNQLHKALYLGDEAELNCKPELEIYADDVKCSHGASSGALDRDEIFYLTSRGIGKIEAENMLIEAHLREISEMIDNEKIKDCFFS